MPDTLIHVTTQEPYLETQGHFIKNYVENPDYAYWDEPYRIALYTDAYTPRFSNTYTDIPREALSEPQPLDVWMAGDELAVMDVRFTDNPASLWHGLLVYLDNPAHTLIMSSTVGFPCRGAVRLRFACAQLQAQIQHAAYDAQCVRALLQAGRLVASPAATP